MMVPSLLTGATLSQLALLAVLTVAAFAARAITLYGLMPLLSLVGLAQRVGRDLKLVILWGGMRGAVSLALAFGRDPEPSSAARNPRIHRRSGNRLRSLHPVCVRADVAALDAVASPRPIVAGGHSAPRPRDGALSLDDRRSD